MELISYTIDNINNHITTIFIGIMRLNDMNSCMYYMQACATAKKIPLLPESDTRPETTTITTTFTIADSSAPPTSAQNHQESSDTQESATIHPTHVQTTANDSANDSEHDSGIFLDDSDRSLGDVFDNGSSSDDKAFEIKGIFGKGTGVIATRDIKRGERILVEKPLIRHSRNFDDAEVIAEYDKFSEHVKIQVSELCNVRPMKPHPILGIIWTNSISLSKKESGLFITASRFNHACTANTFHSWNSDLTAITTHATADIRKGEEITNSYLEGVACWADRQEALARDFGFICDCRCCKLVHAAREQSDYRMRQIWNLEGRLDAALPVVEVAGANYPSIVLLDTAKDLLSCYKRESITDVRLAKPYLYAWRCSIRNGLFRRIVESSKRVWEIYTLVKGEDHPDAQLWRQQHERFSSFAAEKKSFEVPLKEDEDRDEWLFGKLRRKADGSLQFSLN